MSAWVTPEALARLPLPERAYFGLYGRLPDGRRVARDWSAPEDPVREYVRGLERENERLRTSRARFASDRGRLEREICGAIRSAVDAHGPINHPSAPSAAKRVVGVVLAALRRSEEQR